MVGLTTTGPGGVKTRQPDYLCRRVGDFLCEPPAAVVALIELAAATLGARYQTLSDLQEAAQEAVAEVTARIDAGRQNGDLKQVNRQYKLYRQQQIAKAEKAMPYSKFLERFTASIVRDVAINGGAAG
jgi:hypothetical protein